MISFVPYYRKDRGAVVIRILLKGRICKVLPTGLKVDQNQWDEGKRKVINHSDKKLFNQKIQNKIAQLRLDLTKAELLGVLLTQDRVKRIAEGNVVTTDFHAHCEKWIPEKYRNPETIKHQITELNKLKGFAPSLQFGDIDFRFLNRYDKYLRETLKNKGNTPWKAFKFIRTMIYDAEKIGGIVHHNPFKTGEFKMPRYIQPLKDGLTIAELDRLEKILTDSVPVMHKIITAKFLFMCYTGLRISDAKRFKVEEHLQDGERIIITSQKTGITTNQKIYKRLANILKVMGELSKLNLSDQRFNEWLKIIADLAGITRLTLTSHVARHTYGCLLAVMGVSEEEAMQLMGHKRKEVTKVYYQLRQPQIDRASEKLDNI